jgi:hypothetical protein
MKQVLRTTTAIAGLALASASSPAQAVVATGSYVELVQFNVLYCAAEQDYANGVWYTATENLGYTNGTTTGWKPYTGPGDYVPVGPSPTQDAAINALESATLSNFQAAANKIYASQNVGGVVPSVILWVEYQSNPACIVDWGTQAVFSTGWAPVFYQTTLAASGIPCPPSNPECRTPGRTPGL